MSSYMQMGHDTENLIGEKDLVYDGIILSPLNRDPNTILEKTLGVRKIGEFDIIFDTQLYFPHTSKWKIKEYPYFPRDIETADLSSFSWWRSIVSNLCPFLHDLQPDAVTSPVIVPNKFSDDYYDMSINVGRYLSECLASNNLDIRPIQSIIIDIEQLEEDDDPLRLASIISKTVCDEIYLIFVSNVVPRIEYSNSTILRNALKLIYLLEQAEKKTIIAFCSSDMLLYKIAGASSCATGKFFNLRRFSPSRFDDESGGRGQLPYWFEEGLFAFIRQADIIRLNDHKLGDILQTECSENYWSSKILEHIKKHPETAWLALSWRQYLAWFCVAEKVFSEFSISDALSLLKKADDNWGILDDKSIFMEERRNNGEWIRAWLQAISDFSSFI